MKLISFLFLVLVAPAAIAADTSYGRPADPKKAARGVRVEMTDQMRFSPAEIAVKRGEAVRFEAVNKGTVVHEMVIGTMDSLKAHAEHMKAHGGMSHPEPNEVQVEPGKTGVLGWQFTKAGTFYYGCLVPGHFEAGMVGKVVVK